MGNVRLKIFAASLILYAFTASSSAGDKERYFRDYVRALGVEPATLSEAGEFGTEALVVLSSKLSTDSRSLEVLSSKFRFIFFICDSSYIGTAFSCDRTGVYGDVGNAPIYTDQLTGAKVFSYQDYIGESRIEIVPESTLVDPNIRPKYTEYLRDLFRAMRLTGVDLRIPFLPQLFNSAEGTIFKESFRLVFLYAFIISIAYFIATYVRRANIGRAYQDVKNFFRHKTMAFVYIFIVLVLLFIPILYSISIADKGHFSVMYAIEYVRESLNPARLPEYLKNRSGVRFAVFFYTTALAVTGLSALAAPVLVFFERTILYLRTYKVNEGRAREIVIWLALAISFGFVNIRNLYFAYVTVFLIFGLLFLFIMLTGSSAYPFKPLTKVVRMRTTAFFVTVMLMTVLINSYFTMLPKRYDYEDLVKLDSEVIVLPYYKSHGVEEMFSSFHIAPANPIFVDNFLVYYPGFQEAKNKPISDFGNEANIIITASSADLLIEPLQTDRDLRHALTDNNSITPLFYLENFMREDIPYFLEYTIDCSRGTAPLEITAKAYYGDQADSKIPFIQFPGCEDSSGIVSHRTSLVLPERMEGQVLFRLSGPPMLSVLSLNVYAWDVLIPVNYIRTPSNNDLVFERISGWGDKVYSYNLLNSRKINFVSEGVGFDLSEPINKLKEKGYLPNPFKIWTPHLDTVIIKNTLR